MTYDHGKTTDDTPETVMDEKAIAAKGWPDEVRLRLFIMRSESRYIRRSAKSLALYDAKEAGELLTVAKRLETRRKSLIKRLASEE